MRTFCWWIAGIATLFSVQCVAAEACNPLPGLTKFYTDSWGIGLENHRLQRDTTITRENVDQLALAWSYGYTTPKPRSWPLVTEDTIFIGDSGRGIVALDRATGCERWVHENRREISSAILPTRIGVRTALIYLDRTQGIFAIDATDGTLIWNARVDDQPIPMYSGTPIIHDGVVYAPLSSLEIGLTIIPFYGCCTTSGGMAAFDVQTGKKLWFRPTIEEPARQTGRHWLFIEEHGPSGAPVWGAPMLDPRRGIVYFGTGQNYSRPATATSDAIFALKSETGEKVWVHQFTEGDAYNIACELPVHHPNCHLPKGPDVDFGAPPMLVRVADGRELLIAGQKSADIYALNPDTGEVVWHNNLGRGGSLGGIHWGLAANEEAGSVFVPISDIETNKQQTVEPQLGLYALDAATGTVKWRHARASRCAERECFGGLSAAITATPDFVVAGSLDGFLEIYDATNGNVLWADDSWKPFTTVNSVEAKGGAYDAHGPMIAGDQVIVSSGYGDFFQRPGNVLLVYQLKPQHQQGGAP